jgi:hypothetical protein
MELLSLCRGFQAPPRRPSNCVAAPEPIIKKPDPAIYDQSLVLSQGGVPSWDSPDLFTHDFPGFTPLTHIDALVHNLSTEASACNVQVEFAWSPFGIGLDHTVIGAVSVNVGRGATEKVVIPSSAEMRAAVRFNVFVTLRHPYDKDLTNNQGEQGFDLQNTASVGRAMQFQFPLRNRFSTATDVTLLVDPVQWGVTITPANVFLNAGAQTNVSVTLSIPVTEPSGTSVLFSVYAVTPLGLLGGVGLWANVS